MEDIAKVIKQEFSEKYPMPESRVPAKDILLEQKSKGIRKGDTIIFPTPEEHVVVVKYVYLDRAVMRLVYKKEHFYNIHVLGLFSLPVEWIFENAIIIPACHKSTD